MSAFPGTQHRARPDDEALCSLPPDGSDEERFVVWHRKRHWTTR